MLDFIYLAINGLHCRSSLLPYENSSRLTAKSRCEFVTDYRMQCHLQLRATDTGVK